MCLSNVFIDSNGEKEEVLGDVAQVTVQTGGLLLTTLFGEERFIEAKIKYVDFLENSVVLEKSRS